MYCYVQGALFDCDFIFLYVHLHKEWLWRLDPFQRQQLARRFGTLRSHTRRSDRALVHKMMIYFGLDVTVEVVIETIRPFTDFGGKIRY